MEASCNSPPEPPNNGSGNPSGAPPPDQVPNAEDLRNDWSLDPDSRSRIIAGLIAMSKPGATTTRRLPDGRSVTTKVTRRHALRAMELATQLGALNLEQQKHDHEANVHNNNFTLNDVCSPALGIAGPRLDAEFKRQGVAFIRDLPEETISEICAQAREECGPESQRGPKPIKQATPEQRQDWPIPPQDRQLIMARLQDMTDPSGEEYQVMRDRERLRAVRLLVRFGRLVLAQLRWDREVETSPQPFDWAAGVAWAKQKEEEEIERQRLENEEWERREQERRQAGSQ